MLSINILNTLANKMHNFLLALKDHINNHITLKSTILHYTILGTIRKYLTSLYHTNMYHTIPCIIPHHTVCTIAQHMYSRAHYTIPRYTTYHAILYHTTQNHAIRYHTMIWYDTIPHSLIIHEQNTKEITTVAVV